MRHPKVKEKCVKCALYADANLFCAQLSGDEMCALSDQSRTKHLKRGDTVDDDTLKHWPIVAVDRGVLSMQHLLQDGRKTIAALFMRGDIIDLRDVSNRNHGALIALGDVDICSLSVKVFERIMCQNPKAQVAIWENLRKQAFRAIDHAGDIAKKQATEKLASFVIECKHRQFGYKEGDPVEIPVRRIDLAEYLGMQPETVSRGFKELEKQGILKARNLKELELLDLPLLRRIASGDKDVLADEPKTGVVKVA